MILRALLITLATLLLFSSPLFASEEREGEGDDILKRVTYLEWHNSTAWAAAGLMGATLLTAPKDKTSSAHKWLGIGAGALYVTSAALAYMAPNLPEGTPTRPTTIWHERLVWIHAPAMLLSVLSGLEAHDQLKNGKPKSRFAKSHKALSWLALTSYAASALIVSNWAVEFSTSAAATPYDEAQTRWAINYRWQF